MQRALPSRIPACGPPSTLSPEKQTTSTPSRRRVGRNRLLGQTLPAQIDQRGAAEIFQQRNPTLARDRRQHLDPDFRDVAALFEVAAVHLQQQRGLGTHGAPVVLGMCPVGGADLDESHARRFEDVGQPERPADLHQFAT